MGLTYKPKVRIPSGSEVARLGRMLRQQQLHTVCEEARCPNMHECWSKGTATIMILGDNCTRNCSFCNISNSPPDAPDTEEPQRVAATVLNLKLKHVVITSVTRDDLPDGGAGAFAAVLKAIKDSCPGVTTELLIPDFQGDLSALELVLNMKPNVLNHNVETVPRLYSLVRPQAIFSRSLQLLKRVAERGHFTKSGMMVGLGETEAEVRELLDELRRVDCRFVTIGQYLQPSRSNLPVDRYVEPEEFDRYKEYAFEIGFQQVQSGALVRSSYQAGEFLR
jgi:lipoyl synthase